MLRAKIRSDHHGHPSTSPRSELDRRQLHVGHSCSFDLWQFITLLLSASHTLKLSLRVIWGSNFGESHRLKPHKPIHPSSNCCELIDQSKTDSASAAPP